MVRRVFFSFHFDRDNWRANQVRNNWVTQDDREAAGYIDAAEWEELKRAGDEAIRRWIRRQMKNTSVTAVLIGCETANRRWVEYEIKRSLKKGNGIVGIRVDNLKDKDGYTDQRGSDPLKQQYRVDGVLHKPSKAYKTHDYVGDNGYDNLGSWVEEAAKIAGR